MLFKRQMMGVRQIGVTEQGNSWRGPTHPLAPRSACRTVLASRANHRPI